MKDPVLATEIRNAKIESVSLGFEDHGILTVWVNCSGSGWGQGFGGYGFSHNPRGNGHIGAPDLADYILGILTALDVRRWEDLPGTSIRIAGDRTHIYRIGHFLKDQWFDPQTIVGKRKP